MTRPHSYDIGYHEAGHALTSIYLGVKIHNIQVISYVNRQNHHWLWDKNGSLQPGVTGICEPEVDFLGRLSKAPMMSPLYRAICWHQAAISIAGPLSTHIVTRNKLAGCLSLAQHDVDNCKLYLSFAKLGHNDYRLLSSKVLAFLKSAPARVVMTKAANRLAWDGALDGRSFHRIYHGVRWPQPDKLWL